MRWEFTDVEFKALCDRHLDGFMPPPLVFTSRTLGADEFDRELMEAGARLAERVGPGFASVFETVVRPEVRVYSSTWSDGDIGNPRKRIRVHGARRGRRAVLITQLPGETVHHSGGYTLTECGPEALAARMVAELPPAEAARGPSVPIVIDGARERADVGARSYILDPFDDTMEPSSAAWWAEPAEWSGAIQVLQARSQYGPRGIAESTMLWRDIPDDGRYLIDFAESEPRAVGANAGTLAEHIEQHVDRILRHMVEHGEELQ
ncbi:ESX secretion-associated protein EspG [Nocardia sp. CC201C]|uniref:ESX secretion-associated protein EspG n=1 Tax=Nocardia sp. CC201C TaxID=3044575 RepID=UPI0024A97E94|nr:ESX secretion-associated protein EspG [Nocardia sp. CC201C]